MMQLPARGQNRIAASARVFPWARIIHDDDNFSIGEHSQIDDFVFIYAARGCHLGRFVHLSSFTSVIGGGELLVGDFTGFSAGVRVITGTDDFRGPYLHTPCVPRELRNIRISRVVIESSVLLGTNTIVFPGVTIGEGASIGAGSIVRHDVEPWGVYTGDPLRKVGERARDGILAKQRIVLERLAAGTL